MLELNRESVGEGFQASLLELARDKTLEVILEASSQIVPGMSQAEARALVVKIQAEKGAPKAWHPPQIRFGVNTLLPFGRIGPDDIRLAPNDIYFLDIGPIFDGYEGDVGRAFAVGTDPEMQKCCQDVQLIWQEVRDHWKNNQVSGKDLYEFAEARATFHGWQLSLEKADGHRVADFPHAARMRGSIKGLDIIPSQNRWILEIQIQHKTRPFGAFYEDILS